MPTSDKRLWLIVAAVVFIPLLATAAAASTPCVVFTGKPVLHLGTLSCPSSPDVANVTVNVGGNVEFVNQTGKTATLSAGDTSKALLDQTAATVTFTKAGAFTVTMVPDCSLDIGKHKSMTVTVDAPKPPLTSSRTTQTSTPPAQAGFHPPAKPAAHPVATPIIHPLPVPTGSSSSTPADGIYIGAAPGSYHDRQANDVLVLVALTGVILTAIAWVRAWMRRPRTSSR